jgi:hypothetical protein
MTFVGTEVAQGQTFFWSRTAQSHSTTSTVAVTVNGTVTTAGPTADTSTTEDLVAQEESENQDAPSLGGGGGDGGSGARVAGNGDNGPDGGDETSLDGEDGPNFNTIGGLGGNAGDDGEAHAWGQSVGEAEFSPDDQAVLSWSYIHNQYADLELVAAGGGGGGEAGEAGGGFVGGNGGSGGDGEDAAGTIVCTQTSTVNVTAQLQRVAMSSATPTTGRYLVDIGWVSSAEATLQPTTTGTGSPWGRTCTIVISQNGGSGAVLTITGAGGATTLNASGTIPGVMQPFLASSNANLDSVTGELIVDFDDFVFPVALNDTVNIRADGTGGSVAVASVLTGNMRRTGGFGAGGGLSGTQTHGANGLPGDMGGGADGGLGGSGTSLGGNGGNGGDGGVVDAHEDGIFQGLIEVWVDN